MIQKFWDSKHLRSLHLSQLSIFVLGFVLIGSLLFRTLAAPNPNLLGDLDGTNKVDSSDLTVLLSDFSTSNAGADINSDGSVNIFDLSILLSNYGQTYTPPGSGIPLHVETWAYDDYGQAVNASTALVQQWVTYAESRGNNKAVTDCHAAGGSCYAMRYFDPSRIYSCAGCSVPISAAAQENWWLHIPGYTDSAHRLVVSSGGSPGNLLNLSVQAARDWLQNYARANYDSWDGLFVDDIAAGLNAEVFGSGYTSSQEITSDSQVITMNEQMAAAFTHLDTTPFIQISNTFNPNTYVPKGLSYINSQPGWLGLAAEGYPVSDGTIVAADYYKTLLDSMAHINNNTSGALLLLSVGTGGSVAQRELHAGTVLLGYSPGHVVSWEDLDHPSTELQVWPEEGIYPTQPLQSMTAPGGTACLAGTGTICTSGGHNDIQVAPDVYRREWTACYNQGTAIGRCAVIVNMSASAVTTQSSWLTQSYSHRVTFVGGTVEAGGTLNLTGGSYASGTSVPAKGAIFLTP